MEHKVLFAATATAGTGLAGGGGYLIYNFVTSTENISLPKETKEKAKEEKKTVEESESKKSPKVVKQKLDPFTPRPSSIKEKKTQNYAASTIGKKFGDYLLDEKADNNLWEARFEIAKTVQNKLAPFISANTVNNLIFACDTAYKTSESDWKEPFSYEGDNAKKFWNDFWDFCAADVDEEKPDGWPFKDTVI